MRALVPPTIPDGTERVRVCLHAGNTKEEIESLVRVVMEWVEGKEEGEAKGKERARL